jgi:hypothetical protein
MYVSGAVRPGRYRSEEAAIGNRTGRTLTFVIHQSDLQSWGRCPQAWHLERQGARSKSLSATAYGVVMHHALHEGARANDVNVALETFTYYWHPLHIEALCPPVDTWIMRDSYSSLLATGREAIRRFFDLLTVDHGELLALEYEFIVPLHGVLDPVDGSTVVLAGTIDRLVARQKKRYPILDFDDLKTGKKYTYLRHNIQGTTYAYASTQPEFWLGWPEYHTEARLPAHEVRRAAGRQQHPCRDLPPHPRW